MINATVKIKDMPDVNFDFTKEMKESAGLIAAEIRGSILRGYENSTDTGRGGMPLRPNAPRYAAWKLKNPEIGHADPLIAKYRKLVTEDSYVIRTPKKNHAVLTLSNGTHPNSGGQSISEIGTIHNFGTGKMPARRFFGVSPAAVKRIYNYITQRIEDILDGKPSARRI